MRSSARGLSRPSPWTSTTEAARERVTRRGCSDGETRRREARLRGEILDEVRFETYGCVPAIAAASFLSEAVRGRTLEDASRWTVESLVAALGGLPGNKRHCAELALEALGKLLEGARSMVEKKELALDSSVDTMQ